MLIIITMLINAYGHKTYQAGEELQAINPNDPSMWQSWEVT